MPERDATHALEDAGPGPRPRTDRGLLRTAVAQHDLGPKVWVPVGLVGGLLVGLVGYYGLEWWSMAGELLYREPSLWLVLLALVVAGAIAAVRAASNRVWAGSTGEPVRRGSTPGVLPADQRPGARRTAIDQSQDEKEAERQLLEALARLGELTPITAALSTTLTVAQAERALSELARGGHLKVRAESGTLIYGL